MKAILCTHFGGPDELQLQDLPTPAPAAGEALVRVKAAGLNFFDTLIIAGKYQLKPPFPFSPAAEFAGVVERVGDGVTRIKAGDRVVASMGYGAAREFVTINADRLAKLPDGLDFERAAGVIITYGTTLHALQDRAALKRGETLAVLGAAGGVGIAAVELGKLMGARVIACASSDEKLAFTREHGADATINYATEDLKERAKHLTGGRGVDVVYDPVGGAFSEPALRSLGWGGRFLVVGFAAGDIPKIPLNLTLLKGASIVGVFWGEFTRREPGKNAVNVSELLGWLASGRVRPLVSARYPLSKAVEALRAVLDRKVTGKVVIIP